MLDRGAFIEDWRRLMGRETPLTEDNVRTYVNRREDMTRLTAARVRHAFRRDEHAEGSLPPEVADLLKEIDWCLENGQQGPRSRAALASAAMALSGGRALTTEEKARLLELAEKHRCAAEGMASSDCFERLERFVAALLSFRLSPSTDVTTPVLHS